MARKNLKKWRKFFKGARRVRRKGRGARNLSSNWSDRRARESVDGEGEGDSDASCDRSGHRDRLVPPPTSSPRESARFRPHPAPGPTIIAVSGPYSNRFVRQIPGLCGSRITRGLARVFLRFPRFYTSYIGI